MTQYSEARADGGQSASGDAWTHHDVWPNYLLGGYFDAAGDLRPQYVSRSRVEPLAKKLAGGNLTMNQLRRFFQHCRAIEARLKAAAEPAAAWRAAEADFRKLDVAAADAFGKREQKIPELFHDFIRTNVAAVHTESDFLRGFLPHFEALVGFGSLHIKDHRS